MKKVLCVCTALVWLGCGGGSSGPDAVVCNDCPSGPTISADQCAQIGSQAGCKTTQYLSVTDTACGASSPATAHSQCAMTQCSSVLGCAQ